MSYIDFIKELKNADPDISKAVKALRIFGAGCIVVGIWNFLIPNFNFTEDLPNLISNDYQKELLFSLIIFAGILLYSANAIKNKISNGIRLAQVSIISVFLIFTIYTSSFIGFFDSLSGDHFIKYAPLFIFIIISIQFIIPFYFGLSYLQRLYNKMSSQSIFNTDHPQNYENVITGKNDGINVSEFKDALLPFGVNVTFIITFSPIMVVTLLASKFLNENFIPFVFLIGFLIVFFGPIIYNNMSSPFEMKRELISSHVLGGSVFLFSGTWPFFRLLIYKDGIEVRTVYHRFFLPYHESEIKEDRKMMRTDILIISDLPGVPSKIRLYTGKANKIINETNKFKSVINK